ncbi:hypothetical protein ANN_08318 [Periplaneta americana]|uniref:Uncharacterized protein n=1 Tax=Periplaneta americana TaxID=6978 RepID=A0ABQ8T2M6_PERAM|nr:hypothetical protein ANN_08318 [Periplaneta americana]
MDDTPTTSNSMHNTKSFVNCKICHKQFTTRGIHIHINRCHNDSLSQAVSNEETTLDTQNSDKNVSPKNLRKCEICGRFFKSVNRHIVRAHPEVHRNTINHSYNDPVLNNEFTNFSSQPVPSTSSTSEIHGNILNQSYNDPVLNNEFTNSSSQPVSSTSSTSDSLHDNFDLKYWDTQFNTLACLDVSDNAVFDKCVEKYCHYLKQSVSQCKGPQHPATTYYKKRQARKNNPDGITYKQSSNPKNRNPDNIIITPEDIAYACKGIKVDTAPGEDGVRMKVINEFRLYKSLSSIATYMLRWGHVPPCLRRARTILVYKYGDPDILKNWRPITIYSVLRRIIERVLDIKLRSYLDLNLNQRGFMSGPAKVISLENMDTIYHLYEEVGCISSDGSTRRADIIIIDRQKDKGVILDPTIRFEIHEQQPQEVCREKQVIYEPCCQHLGAQYHITHWTVFGLMFGARGTIPRKTLNQLKQYKISDAPIDAIGSHVLKSSLAIISNHLISALFTPGESISDNAMISVYPFGDEFYTFTESPVIHRVDPKTLKTLARVNVSKYVSIVNHTSHPHVMQDGTVYNLGLTVTCTGPHYSIIKFPPAQDAGCEGVKCSEKTLTTFEQAIIVGSTPARWPFHPSYMHTFGITENYFVIVEQPLSVSVPAMIKSQILNEPMAANLQWYQDQQDARTCKLVSKSETEVTGGQDDRTQARGTGNMCPGVELTDEGMYGLCLRVVSKMTPSQVPKEMIWYMSENRTPEVGDVLVNEQFLKNAS